MNLTRVAAAASVCIAGGLALAGTANADPNPLGSYTFEAEDGESEVPSASEEDDET